MNAVDHEISMLASGIDARIAAAARDAAQEIVSPRPKRATYASRRPWASTRTALVTWVVCLALTALNLERGGLFTTALQDPEPEQLIHGLETSAALDARRIEDYRSAHGVLPLSLSSVGLPEADPALDYQRFDGEAYRLIARYGVYEGIFDSRDEARRLERLAEAREATERRLKAEQAAWAADNEQWLAEAEQQISELRPQAGQPTGWETTP